MKHIVQRKILSAVLTLTFLSASLLPFPSENAFAQGVAGSLATVSAPIGLTAPFTPVLLNGVKVDPQKPFHFEFILDRGDTKLKGDALRPEADKLIKYFMAALTISEKDIWVNLSPYEANRIVPESLGETDMGRDLLAQDYLLKQLTASLVNPEGEWGKKFWDAVYKKAYEQFGTTSVPVDTLNKVWIVPSKAVVFESPEGASVGKAQMKVMLEEDYLALQENQKAKGGSLSEATNAKNSLASPIVREIILPLLEKEVNEGRHFAPLRQIYSAIILAAWYKTALKDAVLNRVYSDQDKVHGIDIADKDAAKKIYAQYVEAFQKGVSAMIKVEYDPVAKKNVPRKYFSGGITEFAKLTDPKDPLLERRSGPMSSGIGVTVDLVAAPTQKISSGLVVDKLDLTTFNQIVDPIPGTTGVLGVKAVVYLGSAGDHIGDRAVFFPIGMRHQEIIDKRFPNTKPPYENVFGFELQIDAATGNVLGIQLNWSKVREQKTTFEKIDHATKFLKNRISLPVKTGLVRVNAAITYNKKDMVDYNQKGYADIYREMSTELEANYFLRNPEAAERMVSELKDLLPYNKKNPGDLNKISRTVNHHTLLAIAYELENMDDVVLSKIREEYPELIQNGKISPSLIQSVLNLLAGIKEPTLEEKDSIEKLNDVFLDDFFIGPLTNDLRVVTDRAITLAGSRERLRGLTAKAEAENFGDLIHDLRGTIAASRVLLLTGEFRHELSRDLMKRICTETLAQQLSGDFNGMVDLVRKETVFFPRSEDVLPKEELARFVLRRKGPFIVFRIKTSTSGERSFLRSIEPMAVLKFDRKGTVLSEEESDPIKPQVREAERYLRANMFLDMRLESLGSLARSTMENPETVAFSSKGGVTTTVRWLTSDRQGIPDIGPFFREAFANIQNIINEEKGSAELPSASDGKIASPLKTGASSNVGGIDFDTQGFLETVRREGTRAIVFSDEFLSQKIDGLTPVILSIND